MCKDLLQILEIKCCKTLALTRVLLYTGHSWKCLAGSVWAYTGAPDRMIKMEEKMITSLYQSLCNMETNIADRVALRWYDEEKEQGDSHEKRFLRE